MPLIYLNFCCFVSIMQMNITVLNPDFTFVHLKERDYFHMEMNYNFYT